MDTASLQFFAEAAKDLNFTKTAKRLFISQQNLSNHIARLEEYYGVKLFERKPRLSLSYSGEVLLAYANNFRIEQDNLFNVLADIREKEKGSLRIGCSLLRTSIAMPNLAERFAQDYPNVELHFFHHHTRQLAEMMLLGELDFSVSVDKIVHPSLLSIPLFKDTVYLMVSEKLLQKYFGGRAEELIKRSLPGASLKDFISLPFTNVLSSSLFEDCFTYSGLKPNFIITTTYPLFFMQNYYENIAASIITRTIYLHLRTHVSPGILFFPIIPPANLPLHDIAFIRNRKKHFTQYGQHFLNMTTQYFRDLEEMDQ